VGEVVDETLYQADEVSSLGKHIGKKRGGGAVLWNLKEKCTEAGDP